MAFINEISLKITRNPDNQTAVVDVGYLVSGSPQDISTQQNYRELCELIGDDTPGDGTDDVLKVIGDQTTVFTSSATGPFARVVQLLDVPLSLLNEDNSRPFPEQDEIRARVTMTPIATRRESNLVRIGGPVIGPT